MYQKRGPWEIVLWSTRCSCVLLYCCPADQHANSGKNIYDIIGIPDLNIGRRLCKEKVFLFICSIEIYDPSKCEGWNFNSGNYLFTTDTK